MDSSAGGSSLGSAAAAADSSSSAGFHRTINTAHYNVVEQKQAKPQQRMVLIWHFAFKSLALFIYLFSGWMHLGFIATFVFVLLLLSVDFWVVKNLSGRLLAGLR